MKKALIFPGYMDQYIGMGKDLYDEYRIVQEYFEEALNCTNINFVKLCFASSASELSRIHNAYMSLFLLGYSVFGLLKEANIVPDLVAGYNNGEIAALSAAGCFSLPDGLYLLAKYSALYQEALETLDVAVVRISGISEKQLNDILKNKEYKDHLTVAFYHDTEKYSVSGNARVVSLLYEELQESDGISVEYETTEMGLHSYLMNDTIDQFRAYLEKVDFKDLSIPVMRSFDGTVIQSGDQARDSFIRHFVSPIKFTLIIEALSEYDVIMIASPAKNLYDIITSHYPEKMVVAIEKKADIELLKKHC